MQTHRKHVLKNRGRWLDVKHVRLDRPRSEILRFDSIPHCDRDVLMPWNFPVCVCNLVEQNTPNRKEVRTKNGLDQHADFFRLRQIPYLRGHVQKITYGKNPTAFPH